MHKILMHVFFLGFSIVSFSQHSHISHPHTGQQNIKMNQVTHSLRNIMLTGGIGMASYYGDLCEKWNCFKFRHSLSFGGYYRFNSRFTVKGDLFWTRLAGADKKIDDRSLDPVDHRNLSFRTDVFEFSVSGTFDIFEFSHNYASRLPFEPYLHAGIGIMSFNPKAQLDGKWYPLRDLRTEGQKTPYDKTSLVIPFGAGVRYKFNPRVNLVAEFGYRMTFTDYLDDVSTVYADQSNKSEVVKQLSDRTYGWENDRKRSQGMVRGNPDKNDGYFVFSFKVEYLVHSFKDEHHSRVNDINRLYQPKHFKKRK